MGKISVLQNHLPEILRLKDQGYLAIRIADILGVPKTTLHGFCHRRGISFPKNVAKKVQEDRLRQLIAAGHTQLQIAAALAVSRSAIERRCAKLGLQTARTGPRFGSDHRNWNQGRSLDKHAYVRIWAPLHPQASQMGYVLEHRIVAEVNLGRYLERREVVNHRDGHPWHNWPANLEVFASNADHLRSELTHRTKATPRASIPGAYASNRKLDHCPDERETLGRSTARIRDRLSYYIESHRPTSEHRNRSRRELRGIGAWRDPFQSASRA